MQNVLECQFHWNSPSLSLYRGGAGFADITLRLCSILVGPKGPVRDKYQETDRFKSIFYRCIDLDYQVKCGMKRLNARLKIAGSNKWTCTQDNFQNVSKRKRLACTYKCCIRDNRRSHLLPMERCILGFAYLLYEISRPFHYLSVQYLLP